ncbi:Glycine betaine/carnitine/choline transport system permease protein OpuCD [Paenibacillus konkukensis]|uniref:Glycine betaine/carnitine/choline transport system permease protein OpuCD n=1 Tax=Paenibacillus konkukensis TaxID=2020716 RepID=A0ABY4RL51_9BACL|nr:Glycine betaine/carnitine/choline transport system permease protein OpuCD [Paenibacillus konkukensis]
MIMRLFAYFGDHAGDLAAQLLDHIFMVVCGIALALVVGIPLGIASARKERLARPVLALANVIQVFPSLALLAMLMLVFGLGFNTVVIGLFLYSLLPIIRNTYVGLKQVDRSVVEAGRGVGMSPFQLLWKVQLPLALPVVMAGLRVAAVIAVGVATLAPLIGGEGLGREIYSGLTLRNDVRVYAGAIPAALLALLADYALGRLQEKLKTRRNRAADASKPVQPTA